MPHAEQLDDAPQIVRLMTRGERRALKSGSMPEKCRHFHQEERCTTADFRSRSTFRPGIFPVCHFLEIT
jgi:hypothetical protein